MRARSATRFQWTREQIARQIVAEQDEFDDETLKLLVALRLCGSEPEVRRLIEEELANVSLRKAQDKPATWFRWISA